MRDQVKKEALIKTCDGQVMIARAPLVFVFCADVRRWYTAFAADPDAEPREPGAGDAVLAIQDATIAAQNAVVAAESLGLGSCYIGDILENHELQAQILGTPDLVIPCALLIFGYPTEQQKLRPKPRRFDLSTIVFEDEYRIQSVEEINAAILDKLAGASGLAGSAPRGETIAAFCKRKWNDSFSREMTRSVNDMLGSYPFKG